MKIMCVKSGTTRFFIAFPFSILELTFEKVGNHTIVNLTNCIILQNKRRRWLWVPPPPIIFERQILPQQTIYRWKGNLTTSRIHFKYWKNILISRFYEQFSQNGSTMALGMDVQKISYIFSNFTKI